MTDGDTRTHVNRINGAAGIFIIRGAVFFIIPTLSAMRCS